MQLHEDMFEYLYHSCDRNNAFKELPFFKEQFWRRERYVIMTMWKILNGHHPNNMGIEFQSSKRNGITAKLPKLSKSGKAKHQTMHDTSFAVLGPMLWNLIPANVSSEKDLEVFKIELNKDFLSKMPDMPPVKGYSCENNNSWNGALVEHC
ncbi:unnamed protein product [Gadus morhua 'NCC']